MEAEGRGPKIRAEGQGTQIPKQKSYSRVNQKKIKS